MKKLIYFLTIFMFFTSIYAIESTHFIFEGKDTDITADLVTSAENQYSKWADTFDIDISEKICIEIYPNLLSFHKAMNILDACDYFIACSKPGNIIATVSPLNSGPFHSYESVKRAMLGHIATELLSKKANADLAKWLQTNFGYFATSELDVGKEMMKRRTNQISYLINDPSNFSVDFLINSPSFRDFEKAYNENDQFIVERHKKALALGHTFIDFIVSNYDFEKLIDFSKTSSVEDTFLISKEIFEELWFEYTKTNFLLSFEE